MANHSLPKQEEKLEASDSWLRLQPFSLSLLWTCTLGAVGGWKLYSGIHWL